MAHSSAKKLKDFHRAFLVMEFACFSTPKEAAEALKEEYGIDISPQGAQHYDVTKNAGKRQAAKKWHDLFAVARKAFLDDVEARIPEVHKSVRIQELAKASRAFKRSKNYMAMAAMLERIAKELGGAFTNRTELTGKNRGPIKFQEVDDMTDDQIDEELRRLLNIGDGVDIHEAPESKQ